MFKIVKYDLINGGKRNIFKYCVIIIFVILVCNQLMKYANSKIQGNLLLLDEISYGDYVLYYLSGMKELVLDANKQFEIPYIWMAEQLLLCSLIFSYPIKDVRGQGKNILLQYGSRQKWWLSKCIWTLVQVLVYYLIVFSVIGIYTVFTGKLSMSIHASLFSMTDNVTLTKEILPVSCIYSNVLYSVTIGMIQITISLLMTFVTGILLVVIYDIVALFIMNIWVLGNCSMLYRNDVIVVDGINVNISNLLCMILIILTIIISIIYFKRYDILPDRRD